MRAHDTAWFGMDVQRLANKMDPRDVTDQLLASFNPLLNSDPSLHRLASVDISTHESDPHSLDSRLRALLLQASNKNLRVGEETDWDRSVVHGFAETSCAKTRRRSWSCFNWRVLELRRMLGHRKKPAARSIQKFPTLGNFLITGGINSCPKLVHRCLDSP